MKQSSLMVKSSHCCLHIQTVRTSHILVWRCGAYRRRVGWDKSRTNRLLAWKNKKDHENKKTQWCYIGWLHPVLMPLCTRLRWRRDKKKVWDSEQQGVGVCPGWRHFWVGFRCHTFPEQERSTDWTQCFKSDTLWASCTPLIQTGKLLFSLLTSTISEFWCMRGISYCRYFITGSVNWSAV